MNYKVGDKVKIRPDLKRGDGANGWNTVEDMLRFKGWEATIKDVSRYGNYTLNIDGGYYGWVDEMLVPPIQLQCPADCMVDNFVVVSGTAVSITNKLSYFNINGEKFTFCPACGRKLNEDLK